MTIVELITAADALKARGDTAGVVALYDAFLAHNPDHPLLYAALFNLGVILTDAGDLTGARQRFEHAVTLNPDFYPAHINLGRVHERMGAGDLAVMQWAVVNARLPQLTGAAITHKTMALNQTARLLEGAQQDAACEANLRLSLELDPHQPEAIQHLVAARQRQCAWPVIAPFDRMSRAQLLRGMSPLSCATYSDDALMQLALNALYNAQDVGTPERVHSFPAAASRKRLRIGYLSSDLREHAIGHLMHEVLGLHDREQVEVFAYYSGIPAANDPIQQHYRATADRFIDLSALDDATAAQTIADDGIQILIDVNGYTRDGRTKLVALRPAPVIVNWLGFPGSMASPHHHYIIADDWIIPEASEAFYSEQVVRLPCYQPNNRKRVVAETPARAEAGLPDDAFVFCCFNGAQKITRQMFDRWLNILGRVPGSVLWLLSSTDGAHATLRAYAEARGVAGDRLIFAPKLSNPHHLARYPLADLFLDTTPYGAHTTSSDALWMGVPVVTFSGQAFASRVCGSLVRSAGLPELVTETLDDYANLAVALGRDPERLEGYRQTLKDTRDACVLFDTPGLVAALEGLYAGMWGDYVAGILPQPDLRNLDTYLDIAIALDADGETGPDHMAQWRTALAKRNQSRAIPYDNRVWTAE